MKEFWTDEATDASWEKLQELSKETDFVLIGGWAVYLYTKLQKSKDIDMIVDFNTLRVLESSHKVVKNDGLKKYEIRGELFDIDIYLPKYSRLALPPEDILNRYTTRVEGFTVPTPEALLVLKSGAAVDRGESEKGMKDAIDILGLLFYSGVDVKALGAIISEYELGKYLNLLTRILTGFNMRDIRYLNLDENSFSKLKAKYLERIRGLR